MKKMFFLFAMLLLSACGPKTDKIDARLVQVASELNLLLPTMIEEGTRMDSVVADGKTLRYNYTLVNLSASMISADDLKNGVEKIRINQVNKVCIAKNSLDLLKKGVTLTYAYHGNDGELITVTSVVHSQCAT